MSTAPTGSSPDTSSYANTHCTTCKAGWTRMDGEGRKFIVCLLDREKAWPPMTDCSRFEKQDGIE